jgi:hypothetical protein
LLSVSRIELNRPEVNIAAAADLVWVRTVAFLKAQKAQLD